MWDAFLGCLLALLVYDLFRFAIKTDAEKLRSDFIDVADIIAAVLLLIFGFILWVVMSFGRALVVIGLIYAIYRYVVPSFMQAIY